MTAINLSFFDSISHTLLITLWAKAEENKAHKKLFTDAEAARLVQLLPAAAFDFPKKKMMMIGSVVRTRYFDDCSRQSLAASPMAVLVHLGCGLDDRFGRTDRGQGVQINIDLPDVIELRNRLMPPSSSRNINWPGNIFETDWMDRLTETWAEGRFTFFMEGLMMYLDEKEVQHFFQKLADRFPGSMIHFDVCDSWMCKKVGNQKIFKTMGTKFLWGMDDISSLTKWHPSLRHKKTAYYFNLFKERWGLLSLARFIPKINKGSKMLTYEVAQQSPT